MPPSSGPLATTSLAIPHTQNTAPVIEFRCLFTPDLRRKQKRWQDGRLKFHTHNKRVMVYDERGNYVGDSHWREDHPLEEGEELQLERGGILVEVQECLGKTDQDLTELVGKRIKEKEDRAAAKAGNGTPMRPPVAASKSDGTSGVYAPSKPLNALLTPSGHYGRAILPTTSPFEDRKVANGGGIEGKENERPAKRQRMNDVAASKSGYAQNLMGATLILSSSRPTSTAPIRYEPFKPTIMPKPLPLDLTLSDEEEENKEKPRWDREKENQSKSTKLMQKQKHQRSPPLKSGYASTLTGAILNLSAPSVRSVAPALKLVKCSRPIDLDNSSTGDDAPPKGLISDIVAAKQVRRPFVSESSSGDDARPRKKRQESTKIAQKQPNCPSLSLDNSKDGRGRPKERHANSKKTSKPPKRASIPLESSEVDASPTKTSEKQTNRTETLPNRISPAPGISDEDVATRSRRSIETVKSNSKPITSKRPGQSPPSPPPPKYHVPPIIATEVFKHTSGTTPPTRSSIPTPDQPVPTLRIKSRPRGKMMMLIDRPSSRTPKTTLLTTSRTSSVPKAKEKEDGKAPAQTKKREPKDGKKKGKEAVMSQATAQLHTFCANQEAKLQGRMNRKSRAEIAMDSSEDADDYEDAEQVSQDARLRKHHQEETSEVQFEPESVPSSPTRTDKGIDHCTIDTILSRKPNVVSLSRRKTSAAPRHGSLSPPFFPPDPTQWRTTTSSPVFPTLKSPHTLANHPSPPNDPLLPLKEVSNSPSPRASNSTSKPGKAPATILVQNDSALAFSLARSTIPAIISLTLDTKATDDEPSRTEKEQRSMVRQSLAHCFSGDSHPNAASDPAGGEPKEKKILERSIGVTSRESKGSFEDVGGTTKDDGDQDGQGRTRREELQVEDHEKKIVNMSRTRAKSTSDNVEEEEVQEQLVRRTFEIPSTSQSNITSPRKPEPSSARQSNVVDQSSQESVQMEQSQSQAHQPTETKSMSKKFPIDAANCTNIKKPLLPLQEEFIPSSQRSEIPSSDASQPPVATFLFPPPPRNAGIQSATDHFRAILSSVDEIVEEKADSRKAVPTEHEDSHDKEGENPSPSALHRKTMKTSPRPSPVVLPEIEDVREKIIPCVDERESVGAGPSTLELAEVTSTIDMADIPAAPQQLTTLQRPNPATTKGFSLSELVASTLNAPPIDSSLPFTAAGNSSMPPLPLPQPKQAHQNMLAATPSQLQNFNPSLHANVQAPGVAKRAGQNLNLSSDLNTTMRAVIAKRYYPPPPARAEKILHDNQAARPDKGAGPGGTGVLWLGGVVPVGVQHIAEQANRDGGQSGASRRENGIGIASGPWSREAFDLFGEWSRPVVG